MPDTTNKRRCYARIEFRTVKAQVEQKLAEGYSIKLLYDELTAAGSVTMSYTTFCDYIRGQGERRHGKKKTGPKPGLRPQSNQTESKPAPRIDKSTPFKLEKSRLEDLI